MVSSEEMDNVDISDVPSQEHEHVHGGDSISGEMHPQEFRRDSISGFEAKLSCVEDEQTQGSRRDSVSGLEGEDKEPRPVSGILFKPQCVGGDGGHLGARSQTTVPPTHCGL